MNTWTFRDLVCAGAILALASCDEIGGLGLSASSETRPLPSATLGRGAVALVPPTGYCVDARSLRQSFALMARCDTLGAKPVYGAPLAVITATATARTGDSIITVDDLGNSDEKVIERTELDDITLIQVQGTPPSPAMRNVFWRAVGQIGDLAVGLAIYEAADGAQLGRQAPRLLVQTMRRTIAKSATLAAQRRDNSATPPAKPIGNAGEAGLSE
jgi:hypothetical protein